MLLTGAPDFCEAAALFKINFIEPYDKGYVVELVSMLEDKLLCVDCSVKEPVFVLLSQVSYSLTVRYYHDMFCMCFG